jgi:peptide/nickel transport system substrate-binding protein
VKGAIGTALNPMMHHLLMYNRKMELVPEAAESFEILPDGVTYRFKLRRGITFWNGEPLDARAVKFTYERVADPELRKQGLNDPIPGRQGIVEVKILDDYTVDVVTKERSAITLILFPLSYVVAPGYYGGKSPQEVARAPMGSGPRKFKEWVKDDHLTMVANPDYFRGAPRIETLIYRVAPDRNTRLAMLETGQADLISGITPEDFPILDRLPDVNKVAVESTYRMHVGIPTQVERYKDKRVRQALAMAADFDSLNRFVLGGLASGRMAAPVTGDFWQSPNIKPVEYNPQRARELLAEAGFPMGEKITIYTFNGSFMKDLKLSDQAQRSLDAKEQQQLVWKAEEIFMDEAPWIMLHREILVYGVNKRINWVPTGYSQLHPWLPDEEDVRLG